MKNISFYELIRANVIYVGGLFFSHIRAALIYRKMYRNWMKVIFQLLRNYYPIEAIDRNGNGILLSNRSETSFVTRLYLLGYNEFEICDNKVTISYLELETNQRKKATLYDGISNGGIIDIFFDKIYDFLPAHGKTIIDIGANIGDSCIYFALRGSCKIIGFEPFPRNYEMAKKNIEANGLTDKITLQLAGCACENGDITIDPLYESNECSYLVEFQKGIKIPLITLRDILVKNNISRGEVVLKMDCEGCEYDSILSCTADTLEFFTHIQIEYHHGYKNLKEKLETCGFCVSVTKPALGKSTSIHGKAFIYRGFLYAIRTKQNMVDNLT